MENNQTTEEQPKEDQVGKYSITDAAIQKMKDEFLIMKINGIEDKAGHDIVYQSRQVVKKTITNVEKKRKELKAPVLLEAKTIDDEAERITKELASINKHLQDEEDEYNRLKLVEKTAEENKKKELIRFRVSLLLAAGMQFDGVNYFLPLPQLMPEDPDSIMISAEDVVKFDDEKFDKVLNQASTEYSNQQAAKVAEKQKLEDEKIRVKAESDALIEKENALKAEELRLLDLQQSIATESAKLAEQQTTLNEMQNAAEALATAGREALKITSPLLPQIPPPQDGDKVLAIVQDESGTKTFHGEFKNGTALMNETVTREIPFGLTLENFWNKLTEEFPKEVKHFGAWIDEYKKRVDWDNLFSENRVWHKEYVPGSNTYVKYHDLPLAMQFGIFCQYVVECGEVVYLADCPGDFIDQIREYFSLKHQENDAALTKENDAY